MVRCLRCAHSRVSSAESIVGVGVMAACWQQPSSPHGMRATLQRSFLSARRVPPLCRRQQRRSGISRLCSFSSICTMSSSTSMHNSTSMSRISSRSRSTVSAQRHRRSLRRSHRWSLRLSWRPLRRLRCRRAGFVAGAAITYSVPAVGAAALSIRSGTGARFGARIAGRCVCLGGYGVGGAAGMQVVLLRQRLYTAVLQCRCVDTSTGFAFPIQVGVPRCFGAVAKRSRSAPRARAPARVRVPVRSPGLTGLSRSQRLVGADGRRRAQRLFATFCSSSGSFGGSINFGVIALTTLDVIALTTLDVMH